MKNEVLDKLKELKTEWDNCERRITEIKEELTPIIIERFKQLNYKEEIIERKIRVAPRKFETEKAKIGTVNWLEDFKDADSGEVTTINRSQIVMENDDWYIGAFPIILLIDWNWHKENK